MLMMQCLSSSVVSRSSGMSTDVSCNSCLAKCVSFVLIWGRPTRWYFNSDVTRIWCQAKNMLSTRIHLALSRTLAFSVFNFKRFIRRACLLEALPLLICSPMLTSREFRWRSSFVHIWTSILIESKSSNTSLSFPGYACFGACVRPESCNAFGFRSNRLERTACLAPYRLIAWGVLWYVVSFIHISSVFWRKCMRQYNI